MFEKVGVLDTSIATENTGDLIIMEAAKREIEELKREVEDFQKEMSEFRRDVEKSAQDRQDFERETRDNFQELFRRLDKMEDTLNKINQG